VGSLAPFTLTDQRGDCRRFPTGVPTVLCFVKADCPTSNRVLPSLNALSSRFISETEFRRRDDLRRTLEAEVPVVAGRVRVVSIEGFDTQACGGTHVRHTAEVGRLSIYRTENKGRINKRLYMRLAEPGA